MSAVVFVRRRKLSALLVFACLLASWCVYQSKRPSWEAASRIRDAVSGRTVVIDAGHGGMDPGAVGRSGTREADVVLSIALRLRSLLNRAGVEVVMTRVDDYDLAGAVGSAPAVRKRHDLQERVRLIKEASPDLTVSIHANSFPEPIWSGAQTFFKEGCTEGRLLAVAIQDSLVRDLGPNLRKAKSADLYLLKRIDP
ncbi:MAG: N-acetylmuramoyl-L-alanine amidase CwlD, partial [Firmicutes bacterium]|nr:N-acetylmuramoyl-L-alanine amidase CwlD [Bacillota bacterium]